MRNAGTKKLWITSCEVMIMRTSRPDGNMQLIDLALPFRVLELPHPLLAHGVNFHRSLGGRVCMKKITDDQTKMIITMASGMPVQSNSSTVEP